jgi:hypothetical protein
VLEVAFDVIQPSTRHDSGYALRFPRIVRLRRDKQPTEIDTLSTVANTFEGPVRIHERTTLVVGPDGAVRVEGSQFDFVGCPAA